LKVCYYFVLVYSRAFNDTRMRRIDDPWEPIASFQPGRKAFVARSFVAVSLISRLQYNMSLTPTRHLKLFFI
jgi:hypothetical protein